MSSEATWSLEGVDRVAHALVKRVEAMNEANEAFIREAAYSVEREAKKRVGEGGRHKAGTPTPAIQGSGPAVVSGNLRRSIHTFISGPRGNRTAMIGPSAIYGRHVELEYDYPYMAPTVDVSREPVLALARKWYGRALRG